MMTTSTPAARPGGGEAMPGWQPAPGALCAKCGVSPVGPGGILCPPCRAAIGDRIRRAAGRPEPAAPDPAAEQPSTGRG